MQKKIEIKSLDQEWINRNISVRNDWIEERLKRIFDVLLSCLGLLILLILFFPISLAIKLNSTGPILYKQKRVGLSGKIFLLYKFRTMIFNAEETGPQWSGSNDERITPIGRFLRTLHIDELPQFYNILMGDLSLVGPRPERPEFEEELKKEIPFYSIRHSVKPGLTGWAQVNYPASATIDEAKEKFQYDLYYLQKCSLLMDTLIVIKTIKIILIKTK